jgi:hypothetical protein
MSHKGHLRRVATLCTMSAFPRTADKITDMGQGLYPASVGQSIELCPGMTSICSAMARASSTFRSLPCNLIHSPIVSVPVGTIGKRRELDLETLERWWRMHPVSLQKVYKDADLRQP